MEELAKDIKVLKMLSKGIEYTAIFKTALTVGIIVFSVLEGIRWSLNSETLKKAALKLPMKI